MVNIMGRTYISGIVIDSSPGADNIPHLLDPKAVRGHFDRIRRFRVLVLGKANAGKTTLLQRVCNTTELPEVFNGKGEKVGCLTAQYCQVIHEYSQLDLTTVQGSLQVRFTILGRHPNRLIMPRGDIMTLRMSLFLRATHASSFMTHEDSKQAL